VRASIQEEQLGAGSVRRSGDIARE
jgi:hypothetical protein